MNSPLEICSRALVRLGCNPLSSFNDNSAEAKVAKSLFDSIFFNSLTSHTWNFAMRQQKIPQVLLEQNPKHFQLSNHISATDSSPQFQFTHQLPENMLRLEKVLDDDQNIILDYKILSDIIFSNNQNIYLEFVSIPDLSKAPFYFIYYLELLMATNMAIPITENSAKANTYQKMAAEQFMQATYLDAQAQPTTGFDLTILGQARHR